MPNFNDLKGFKHKKSLMIEARPATRHRSYPVDCNSIYCNDSATAYGFEQLSALQFFISEIMINRIAHQPLQFGQID